MSVTRSRFCRVSSILRSASFRRCLYLVTPAASSMKVCDLPGADDLTDAALLDDGVGLGADAGAEKEIGHAGACVLDR